MVFKTDVLCPICKKANLVIEAYTYMIVNGLAIPNDMALECPNDCDPYVGDD